MKIIISLLVFLASFQALSSNDEVIMTNHFNEIPFTSIQLDTNTNKDINKTKIIAVTLAITLGVFGVHRLYLGTKALVPISYTLTLGGGMGILPIIDIFYILTAKDINQIKNNDFIFMWNKNKEKK